MGALTQVSLARPLSCSFKRLGIIGARMKTRSGRYIIPVQIDLFDAGRIKAARKAVERASEDRG